MPLSKKMERYDAERINIKLVLSNVQVDIFQCDPRRTWAPGIPRRLCIVRIEI